MNKKYLDKLNEDVEDLLSEELAKDYKVQYSNFIEDTLNNKKSSFKMSNAFINLSNRVYYITVQIENAVKVKKKNVFSNIATKNPKVTANRIFQVAKSTDLTNGKMITLSKFLNSKSESNKIKKISTNFVKSNKEMINNNIVKSNLSKNIIKDFRKIKTSQGKPLTFEQRNNIVRKKYENVKGWYVERIVRTEQHSQNQAIKQITAKINGYTHKKWVSVSDSRVRSSHNKLHNKTIKIDDRFNNGGLYPGDPDLKASERINCRCRLEFLRR